MTFQKVTIRLHPLRGTNADTSHDHPDHEAVIEQYRQWEKQYDLKLVGAGQDWLEAEIRNPPKDWLAFANEVYEFCPDIVDQGTGDVASLAEEMKRSGVVYLWWD